MSGINSILNIASTSIAAQQVALNVTSENIANINTPGYSRQRAVMETAPVNNSNGFPLGSGVVVKSVQRFYDAALQKNITDGNSLLQNNQSRLTSLQAIEPSFNDVTTNGLGQSIQDFFDSWQSLSDNASGTPERQAVLAKAQVMVDNFHQVNQTLRDQQTSANNSLDGITADITLKAKSIASLNDQIAKTEQVGASSSELRDQRDYLVQELGKDSGCSFTEEQNGSVTVKLASGSVLVQGNQYATVYTSLSPLAQQDANLVNPNKRIMITTVGNPPPANNSITDTDITATVGGSGNTQGKIGAMLGIRDAVVPGYLRKLDELAYNTAQQVNVQHQKGWDLNGLTGNNFFVSPTGITASSTTLPAQTSDIAGYSSADPSLGIRLNISSADQIAAADTNPLTGGSGNNNNALALAAIKDQQVPFATDGGASSTVISYYNAMVSGVGVDVQTAQNASDQGESYVNQLTNLRESNSGVSLDEEMTNMLKYQKAFQGAAKLISTASDMMDTMLAMVR